MTKTGFVVRVPAGKPYAFIKDDGRTDYFVHRDHYPDFDNLFNDFARAKESGKKIYVEFEPVKTDKGWRAENVVVTSTSL